MKRLIKYMVLLQLALSVSSCHILDEHPKDFISPQNFFHTEDEVESALFGVYSMLHNTYIGDAERIFIGDLGVDVMLCRDQPHKNVYQFYQMESPTVEMTQMWRSYYQGIGAANMVIARTQSSNLKDEFKSKVIAEAKVLRAFFYHGLITLWGDVPMWLEELDLDVVATLPRTPKKTIIQQLYTDFESALACLPGEYDAENLGRITCWAAKGLWARIALFENDWERAYELSADVIHHSPHALLKEYADVFNWKNKFNKELMWVIPCLTDVHGSTIHSFCSPRGRDEAGAFIPLFDEGLKAIRPDGAVVGSPTELFEGWGMFCTSEAYLASFDAEDKRKVLMDWNSLTMTDGRVVRFNGGDGGGKGHYTLKWSAFGEKANNGSRDIHHLRLAEMYLIHAEAANELNKPEEAVADLNVLRERAFGNALHNYAVSLNKNEIKQLIVNENKWELGGEGLRRWYLNHWGFEYLNAAVQSMKDENPKGAQHIKPHHTLFKIPVEEFVKNPNLGTNNPGY